jgi:hypothetical protein
MGHRILGSRQLCLLRYERHLENRHPPWANLGSQRIEICAWSLQDALMKELVSDVTTRNTKAVSLTINTLNLDHPKGSHRPRRVVPS